jgi:alkylhydroperoxidase family enzyme
VPDAAYEAARRVFSEQELVDLTYVVVMINAWNRLSVSFRVPPGRLRKAKAA